MKFSKSSICLWIFAASLPVVCLGHPQSPGPSSDVQNEYVAAVVCGGNVSASNCNSQWGVNGAMAAQLVFSPGNTNSTNGTVYSLIPGPGNQQITCPSGTAKAGVSIDSVGYIKGTTWQVLGGGHPGSYNTYYLPNELNAYCNGYPSAYVEGPGSFSDDSYCSRNNC